MTLDFRSLIDVKKNHLGYDVYFPLGICSVSGLQSHEFSSFHLLIFFLAFNLLS